MKRITIFLMVVLAAISSCKKDDSSVFNESPDDRLNAALARYQTQLSGAQNGWKAVLYPAGGGSYSFYFKFNDANRVSMVSDFDSASAVTLKESSYRLKALQQPSLIFDTYSYIHLLSDPNEQAVIRNAVNTGQVGVGLVSDYEFYFDSTTSDTIKLIGRFNGSKATLVRATAQEATGYSTGQLAAGLNISKIQTYFKRLTVGSQLFDVRISPTTHSITLTYIGTNGVAQTYTTGYYLILGGIALTNPLTVGNVTISSFTNMQWNATTETISTTVNTTASTIAGVVVPLKVDIAAPKRWWDYAVANGNDYWISPNGFHVNGVDDAYGIKSLVSGTNTYYYWIYWPAYSTGNDFSGPIFLNAAQTGLTLVYGTAPQKPTFTTDGRAIFLQLGNYNPYPASGPAVLTRTKLYNSSGYYFVQTSPTTYDMVSASDGKAWMSWQF